MKEKGLNIITRFALTFLVLSLTSALEQIPVQAGGPVGTIAYVSYDPADGDTIHLIEPDGSDDRVIFATGQPISEYLTDIKQLDWKPDAAELAFTSSHEASCSLYETDVYTIRADGSGYRRISGPPACGATAGLPTGTVVVPVQNNSGQMGPFTFYFEGAPGPVEIALSPGSVTQLTFHNVADYGDQEQYAIWMYGDVRGYSPEAKVNVNPGATLETGTLKITTGFEDFGFAWANYVPDGSSVASIFHLSNLVMTPSNNVEMGSSGTMVSFDMTLGADHLAWGPTPDLADLFFFRGWITDETHTSRFPIMLGDTNGTEPDLFLDVDPTLIGKTLLGITWLPDGSGFLYSLTELVGYDFRANIWEFSFGTGKSRRVTNVPYGFTREITVSPDGRTLVFEHQPTGHWLDANPPIDLWMANRDGSGMGKFIEGARAPAWSPKDIPEFVRLYLPLIRR